VKKYLLVTLILLLSTGTAISQIRFSAATERTSVGMGEQIIVSATLVTGKQAGSLAMPQVPTTDGFTLLKTDQRQSSSSSIQIINGKTSQKTEVITQFYYIISPVKTGSFTFPSLEITIDGNVHKTNPITFTVSAQAVSNPDIKAYLQINKRSLFVGEQTIFTFKIAQRAQSSTEVRNGFMPSLEKIEKSFGKDFSMNRLFTNQITTTTEQIDGETYNIYSLKFSLYPLSKGTFSVQSVPFEYQELRRAQRRRNDPFFEDFFDTDFFGGGVQAIQKNAFSNNLSITVKELPVPPADYSGSVGKFSLSANINSTEIPAGEAITLKIAIKGSTRPGSIGNPVIPELPDCDIFKPEIQITSDTSAAGISSKKNFKYLIVPRKEGTVTIPPIRLPYFDPESGTYKIASSDPLTVIVTKGKNSVQTQNRYLTQEEIREVGRDIHYIKTGIKIKNQHTRPYRDPVFILIFPIPFLILILSILYRFQSQKQHANMALSIKKRALSSAMKKISNLKKQNATLSNAQFLGGIADTIEVFISNKFEFPATGRILDDLKTELLSRNTDEKTVANLTSFIEHIDSYRFGGLTLNDKSRIDLLDKTASFVNGLEKNAKKEKEPMARTLSVLFFLLFLSLNIHASTPVDSWFESANQFYAQQQFDSASIYYENIIGSGFSSSEVYFNLGNTHYRLKKPGLARLYYEKALQLKPGDLDIESNIRFLNSNIIDKNPEPQRSFTEMLLWQLHILLPLKTQLWVLFGLLLSISLLISSCFYNTGNTRLWSIYLSVLLSLGFCIIGISTGFKIYELEKISYAILLNPSADVKNAPEGNNVLFTAHEGTKFKIRKTEGSWSLVSLPNGYSGWVENNKLGKI
jgi:tetratricopeptide (TPR) repeat protein